MADTTEPAAEIVLKHRRAIDYRTIYAEQMLVTNVNDRYLITICDDVADLEERYKLSHVDTKPRYEIADGGVTTTAVREDRAGILMNTESAIKLVMLLIGSLHQQGVELAGIKVQEQKKEAK